MIEYSVTNGKPSADIKVLLDGKVVGEIRRELIPLSSTQVHVWRYYPKGRKSLRGEPFHSLRECQKSLEAP